ncbi:MAG: hypothetical protein ACFCUE_14980 [Candidatus Bathyarchaeia archaeon]|jgi:hypothetical protein
MQSKQTQINPESTCIIITLDAENTKPANTSTFNTILTQVIDETFSQLGCKQNIYRELEKKYAINLQEISENPDAFVAALKDMFGESSLLVELKIMSQLHSKTPKTKYRLHAEEELTLCGYLKNLKASLA